MALGGDKCSRNSKNHHKHGLASKVKHIPKSGDGGAHQDRPVINEGAWVVRMINLERLNCQNDQSGAPQLSVNDQYSLSLDHRIYHEG